MACNSDGNNGTVTPPAPPCESCRSSPGIPCCRVEWSFLCSGCAPKIHAQNWIIPVNPNPNLNPNGSHPYPFPHPFPYPYFFPNPTPNPSPSPNSNNDPSPDPHPDAAAAQAVASSDDEAGGRMKSVMRYREKRKTRKFEKIVRYENRKAHAEQRLRISGKFVKTRDDGNGNGGNADEKRGGEENANNDCNASQETDAAAERGNDDETV